jgi:hypothetical protein
MSAFFLATHARPSFVNGEGRIVFGEWGKNPIRYSPLRSSHPLLTASSLTIVTE